MEFLIDPKGGSPKGGQGGTPQGATASNPSDWIIDSDQQAFARDVMEASLDRLVLVDFWAPWCGPCKSLTPTLEKLVRQAGGLVKLVKINVDENQELAMQLRIQSIPTVYAFLRGQPVDAFMGALPESQIKAFIDRHLGDAMPPLEQALAEAESFLAENDPATASQIYNEILAQEPNHAGALAGLIRCLVMAGQTDQAKAMAEGLTPELRREPALAAAIAAIELAELGTSGNAFELAEKVALDPADHQSRFDLAGVLIGQGRTEEGLEHLLEIVSRKRDWNDEAARKQMVKVFEALGAANETVIEFRRRLSSILFS
ncbi:MAG: thioredoxin [Rhodospirillales bacterium]